jgi:hypothetical protein
MSSCEYEKKLFEKIKYIDILVKKRHIDVIFLLNKNTELCNRFLSIDVINGIVILSERA